MNKKMLIGLAVVVALSALSWLFGADVVSMVKSQVGAAAVSSEVAPVSSE